MILLPGGLRRSALAATSLRASFVPPSMLARAGSLALAAMFTRAGSLTLAAMLTLESTS